MPVKHRVTVSLVIDPELLQWLDAQRGSTPRSEVICNLIREFRDQKEQK